MQPERDSDRFSCALRFQFGSEFAFRSSACGCCMCIYGCEHGLHAVAILLSNLSPWRQNTKDKLHWISTNKQWHTATSSFIFMARTRESRTHTHTSGCCILRTTFLNFRWFFSPGFFIQTTKKVQSFFHVADIFHSWHLCCGRSKLDLYGEREKMFSKK